MASRRVTSEGGGGGAAAARQQQQPPPPLVHACLHGMLRHLKACGVTMKSSDGKVREEGLDRRSWQPKIEFEDCRAFVLRLARLQGTLRGLLWHMNRKIVIINDDRMS